VTTLAFAANDRTIATVEKDGSIRLWDVARGEVVRRIRLGKGKEVLWVCFTPDGRKLLAGESWDVVHRWDVDSGKHLDTIRATPRESKSFRPPVEGSEWECKMSSDGRWLAVSSNANLFVWDLDDRSEIGPFEERHHAWLDSGTGAVSISADGRLLAWFDFVDRLQIYERASGKIIHSIASGWITCAFARTGWQLAVPDIQEGTILLWDVGALLRSQPLPSGTANSPEALWPLLADSNAPVAHRALWRMVALPGSDEFLSRQRQKDPALSAERVAGLITDLGSADLSVRLRAEESLAKAREGVQPALEKAQQASTDVEVRARLARLLAKLHPRSPEQLRDARAVLVLEARNTPAARQLLRQFADGWPGARLTREAREALQRLERKPVPSE
jgi:hypothetical protein